MIQTIAFPSLREANAARVTRWHPGGIADWSLPDWALALGGEAGEAANAIKKLRRVRDGIANSADDPARQLDSEAKAIAAISDELADTMIYLDLFTLRAGIDAPDWRALPSLPGEGKPAVLACFLLSACGALAETAVIAHLATSAGLRIDLNRQVLRVAVACAGLAAKLGVDLTAAIEAKFNATSALYGFPERLSIKP